MNTTNPEFYHSCHGHHPHPPFGLFILIPLVLFFVYETKFYFIWPVFIFMIFVFFIAMHRIRYTYNRERNYHYNRENYPITTNYNNRQNLQKIKPTYCKNCGALIEEYSKFCSECGTNLI